MVCHFYGWTDEYVSSLPFSRFSLYFKAAVMLDAREGLKQIQYSNFSNYKSENRDKILRGLKQAATIFEEKKVKDYREVLANIARGLGGGGR